MKRALKKVKRWLKQNKRDKPGERRVKKSNITDNESAKMKTGKG